MTTTDLLFDTTTPTPNLRRFAGPFRFVRRIWQALKRRREERRLVIALSSLDQHLLRDIGIEPIDVIDAMRGRPGPSILFHPMRRPDHE